MPNEFPFIYKSIKNLTFSSEPNYQFFKDKLNDVISIYHGNNEDFCFTKDINNSLTLLKSEVYSNHSKEAIKKLFKGYQIF